MIREIIGHDISFARKITFFYKSFCFQQPLRCYRIDLVTSPVFVRRLLDYNLPLSFVTLDNARKNRPNLFFTGQVAFFFKSLCFQQPISHRNDLITSTVKIKLLFGPLQIVPWGLSQSITGEKKKGNFFSSRKRLQGCLFSKNLCFHQPLESLRNDVMTSTVNVILPCGTL